MAPVIVPAQLWMPTLVSEPQTECSSPVKKRHLHLPNPVHKPTFLPPAFHDYHHHSHQYTMESFHITDAAALWSSSEDQTTVRSETPGLAQPAFKFKWGLDDPLQVSAVSGTWNL
jgi:hypothetical protein